MASIPSKYSVIVIGASIGGISAVGDVLSGLSHDFPIPILVVQHLGAKVSSYSMLPEILTKRTHLRVKWAEEGEQLLHGTVYVAPQDVHLLVDPVHSVHLVVGPKRNFVRPSVDILFESAAVHYGVGAIGVILTGFGRDGAAGGRNISIAGGKLIAQNSATSVNFGMPDALMNAATVDCMLPLDEIAPMLTRWLSRQQGELREFSVGQAT